VPIAQTIILRGLPGPDTAMDFPSRAKDFSGVRK
jgi:hypothetical protein